MVALLSSVVTSSDDRKIVVDVSSRAMRARPVASGALRDSSASGRKVCDHARWLFLPRIDPIPVRAQAVPTTAVAFRFRRTV